MISQFWVLRVNPLLCRSQKDTKSIYVKTRLSGTKGFSESNTLLYFLHDSRITSCETSWQEIHGYQWLSCLLVLTSTCVKLYHTEKWPQIRSSFNVAANGTGCHSTPKESQLDAKSSGVKDAGYSRGYHTQEWPRGGKCGPWQGRKWTPCGKVSRGDLESVMKENGRLRG